MAMGPVQLSYSQNPQEAVLGEIAEGFTPYSASARFARGLVRAGFGLFLSAGSGRNDVSLGDPGEAYHVPFPAAAVSAAALHTGASSASIQTITAFGGVYGASELMPPRQATFAFDSSTDWDPTSGSVTYVNEKGATVTESLAVATSAALTTTGKVKKLVSVTIPAQTGAGGVFTIGVAALTAGTEALFCGVAVRQMLKTTLASSGLFGYPGQLGVTGPADYVDGETVPCLTEGGIWVASETANEDGDPVYIRTAVSGSFQVLGAFANAAGTGRVQLTRARFVRHSEAPASAALYTPSWARFHYFDR